MGRKKDHDYFAMLVEGVNYACEAATMLKTTFENFEPEELQENINKVHQVEHTADMAKHDMMEKLVKEFITPIDREDILELADVIDDVTDDLEEILLKLYMYDIKELKEEAVEFVDIIVRCCGEIKVMMEEFSNFRKSKAIGSTIVSINDMEEEGDKLSCGADEVDADVRAPGTLLRLLREGGKGSGKSYTVKQLIHKKTLNQRPGNYFPGFCMH